MATHPSAAKRNRQNIKRYEHNRSAKSAIRSSIKKTALLVKQGKREDALAEAKKATSLLDKAIVHGVMHKSTAARTISRLHRSINASA